MSRAASASRYRQVRLTFTEQAGGVCSVRVMVKPVNVAWSERHTIVQESFKIAEPLTSMADVYALLGAYLAQDTLPESHT